MILYLDTSALVKRYFREPYSDDTIAAWKSATQIVTSFVAYAESMACIYRKRREADIDLRSIRNTIALFQRDWESFVRVEVTEELKGTIDRVVEKYPLRGFDAIHLASALVIQERVSNDLLFACFDNRLTHAAMSEGLSTLPPCEPEK